MKTTLWNDEDVRRAEPLLARVQQDVTQALDGFDQVVRKAHEAKIAVGAASPAEVRPCWIDLVHAQDDLAEALDRMAVVLRETRELNGSIAFDEGGLLRLAGTDTAGRLAWWKPAAAEWEPL